MKLKYVKVDEYYLCKDKHLGIIRIISKEKYKIKFYGYGEFYNDKIGFDDWECKDVYELNVIDRKANELEKFICIEK